MKKGDEVVYRRGRAVEPLEQPHYAKGQRRKPIQHEEADQTAVILWAKGYDGKSGQTLVHPELEVLYAVPNGARTSWGTAKKLKAAGLLSGVPDLVLPVARGRFHALYIEMKWKDGTVSANQKHIQELLAAQGNQVVVAWSTYEAQTAIMQYLRLPRPVGL